MFHASGPCEGEVLKDVALPPAALRRLAPAVRLVEEAVSPLRLTISPAEGGVRLVGGEAAVQVAEKLLARLSEEAETGGAACHRDLSEVLAETVQYCLRYDLAFRLQGVPHPLRPLTFSQVAFMNAIQRDRHSLIFGIGPTGTGKTHLALAAGLSMLAEGLVQHLVVTRPYVLWEGEVMTASRRADLVNEGQLTPIEDELHGLIGHERSRRLIEDGKIELVPLGYLRGRTFNDSFVLVDEAQNLLVPQMRMVVTRLGRNSRMVIVGDPQQVDLHGDELSGLTDVLRRISDHDLAHVHNFRAREIIRNPVVAQLEALYSS